MNTLEPESCNTMDSAYNTAVGLVCTPQCVQSTAFQASPTTTCAIGDKEASLSLDLASLLIAPEWALEAPIYWTRT